MAIFYVRSTDGSDSDNGSTWALAKATIGGACTASSAGDTIYVSQNHAESTAGAVTITLPGTEASPTRIICANDSAEPPTAIATTATCAATGANGITLGGTGYIYGITFTAGSGSNGGFNGLNLGSGKIIYDSCGLIVGNSTTIVGISGAGHFLVNCNVKTANTSSPMLSGTGLKINGGSILSGQGSVTSFVADRCFISGFDFSNLPTSAAICAGSAGIAGYSVIKNCKLPASWSGELAVTKPATYAIEFAMHNCDNADTNYTSWVEQRGGSIRSDSGIYNDAGATDGTTRISWKMVSNANAEYPAVILRSSEIVAWNDTAGSSKTVTVEIVHNSQGSGTNGVLNDDEIWLEVQYLGTSGRPLGSFITDCKADVLATAAAQTTSSATWTGDSTGWDTQKLEVTFTPQEKGYIHAVVCLAKASATVYVDPLLTVA